MNTPVSEFVETRTAAKLVLIVTKDGREYVLTHEGKSRNNILGGGVDDGESEEDALHREIREEAGEDTAELIGSLALRRVGQLYGLVNSRDGKSFVADWRVYLGVIDHEQMPNLENGEGVIEHELRPLDEAVKDPKMSELAVEAILRAIEAQRQVSAESSAELN